MHQRSKKMKFGDGGGICAQGTGATGEQRDDCSEKIFCGTSQEGERSNRNIGGGNTPGELKKIIRQEGRERLM